LLTVVPEDDTLTSFDVVLVVWADESTVSEVTRNGNNDDGVWSASPPVIGLIGVIAKWDETLEDIDGTLDETVTNVLDDEIAPDDEPLVDTGADAVVETGADAVVETGADAVVETGADAVVETGADAVVETCADDVVE
jgi:hypothetical protein